MHVFIALDCCGLVLLKACPGIRKICYSRKLVLPFNSSPDIATWHPYCKWTWLQIYALFVTFRVNTLPILLRSIGFCCAPQRYRGYAAPHDITVTKPLN